MTSPDAAGPAVPSAESGQATTRPAPPVARPATPARERPSDGPPPEDELPPPTGTLFVMMLYIMLLAGMWGAIYFEFLGR